MKRTLAALLLLLTLIAPALAGDTAPDSAPDALAAALIADPRADSPLVAQLRAAGPAGLQALLSLACQRNPDRDAYAPIVDAVAGQRDALASRLYWYTDLEQAKAAAQSQGKPILYLRLLGKLTDEYSCANSRYFRTVLYANARVSKILRENWILVWVTERPVPVVTVDYGDGRVLKRTITGNSVHYILDPQGRVIDALPGLYGPTTFINRIAAPGTIAMNTNQATLSPKAVSGFTAYLDRVDDRLLREWQVAANAAAPQLLANVPKNPDAVAAADRARSKAFVETPILRKIAPQFAAALDQSTDTADADTWQKIAALKIADARLDADSIELIKKQNPALAGDPAALTKTVEQFERLITLDTVHNEYQLHRRLIAFLREAPGTTDIEALNKRVYTELFLTPRTDAWLGLNPDDAYTALANNGCDAGKCP